MTDNTQELDKILKAHGADEGEYTYSLKQAITDWSKKEASEAYDDGCADIAKRILALFDSQLPEQTRKWLRLEIEQRSKL